MKKKLFILTFLMVFLTGAINLSAFCVYNNSDKLIIVYQVSGGSFFGDFQSELKPGKKACCNWKNKSCNKKKKRSSKVKFKIVYKKYTSKDSAHLVTICRKTIKAGGELVVNGKHGYYQCTAKGY